LLLAATARGEPPDSTSSPLAAGPPHLGPDLTSSNDQPSTATSLPSPSDDRFFQQGQFDYAFLPGSGAQELQINTFQLNTKFAVPTADGWAPLLICPGGAINAWGVPTPDAAAGVPHLPSTLYDLFVEMDWRPRLAEWLFADIAVTPGVYSDFKDLSWDSFQMRGRGLAIVALSKQLQFVGGALYINRNKTKVLPAGGVIWQPNEDTRCVLVFPQPKVSRRLTTFRETEWWGYVAGDFGGGRWSVEEPNGAHDFLDYTDLRVSLGIEIVRSNGLAGRCEVGYVFRRQVNFTGPIPDFSPADTVMVKAGVTF
jgi:hypothetical protein